MKETIENDLEQAVATLRRGGIILYPTDTIWGIGCDASCDAAIDRIFSLKQRADSKSMLVLAGSEQQLMDTADRIPEVAKQFISDTSRPTTIIYDHANGVSAKLIASDGSLGIRLSRHEFSAELCRRLGRPIVSTSANVSGQPSPATYSEISDNIKNGVDYICESERESSGPGIASRIVKVTDSNNVSIIRD